RRMACTPPVPLCRTGLVSPISRLRRLLGELGAAALRYREAFEDAIAAVDHQVAGLYLLHDPVGFASALVADRAPETIPQTPAPPPPLLAYLMVSILTEPDGFSGRFPERLPRGGRRFRRRISHPGKVRSAVRAADQRQHGAADRVGQVGPRRD